MIRYAIDIEKILNYIITLIPILDLEDYKWTDERNYVGQWKIIKWIVLASCNGMTVSDIKKISNGFDRGRGTCSRIKTI